ncbi:EcsC family protein [Ornithinimicrobium sp. W1679]|uniref:EcsC family protein n=1 Tax=Ornithinimicrobium sp. W1679 TaxID=3418770 RepID=UPI003CF0140D
MPLVEGGQPIAGLDRMTPYERRAWDESIRTLRASRRQIVPARLREKTSTIVATAGQRLQDVPGAESVQAVVSRAMDGTLSLTFRPALRTATCESVLKLYARKGVDVSSMADVRELSLEERDHRQPRRTLYAGVAAGEGAATAVAVTGSEVATTVSGGATAGIVVGAVALDAVASLAMMGRAVGDVASRYGYDMRDPGEELFAMGVLSLGMAGDVGAKTQALAALSRLTQRMMRRATWNELNKHLLVKVLQKVYQRLGLRLTQRKLAQVVPVAGIGINAALTASLVDKTFERAQAVYRLRSLSEKYDIDPSTWTRSAVPTPSEEEIVDVIDILDETKAIEERGSGEPGDLTTE